MKKFGFLFLCLAGAGAFALDFKPGEREAVVESARLRAVVRDGRIVHLENRKTGAVYADRNLNEKSMLAGLGHMAGKGKELSRLHFPWGEPSVNQGIALGETDLYHYPCEKSTYSAVRNGDEVVVQSVRSRALSAKTSR